MLDAKRDLRSVGDEMVIDLLRVVARPGTCPLGESRANCPGGHGDSQMEEKSKP